MTRLATLFLPIAFAVALAAAPARAETPEVDCDDPQVQMEMTYCAEQDWQEADKALNEAYGEAMATMRRIDADLPADQTGAADMLRDAQRAWIAYRDKACAAYGYLAHGGTMEPMLIYQCNADLTAQRTEELEQLAAGLGN
jgi:uncharacterized protein YecT (DUF1311 family)|uniref:lysozyme inhibitor LprI family protein n=1 Tax=Stappia sp. TaxID=1870903 RepID=UPI003BABFBEE